MKVTPNTHKFFFYKNLNFTNVICCRCISLYTVPLNPQLDTYRHGGEGALAALVDCRATGGLGVPPQQLVPEFPLLGQGSSLGLPLSYLLVILPHPLQGLKQGYLIHFRSLYKALLKPFKKAWNTPEYQFNSLQSLNAKPCLDECRARQIDFLSTSPRAGNHQETASPTNKSASPTFFTSMIKWKTIVILNQQIDRHHQCISVLNITRFVIHWIFQIYQHN